MYLVFVTDNRQTQFALKTRGLEHKQGGQDHSTGNRLTKYGLKQDNLKTGIT